MSLKEMREELTCPICMELFTQPRRLPCGHSYCHLCIKAILDKKTEESGSYLNYSRTLVCPECREEINIDFVRGIEGIPTDFKLSKLVELFQFMKANEDSDSCDELKIYKSVPCGTAAESAFLRPDLLTSLPATTATNLITSETQTLASNSALQQDPSDGLRTNNSGRTLGSALESPSVDNNRPYSVHPTPASVGSNSDASRQLVAEPAWIGQQEHTVESIEAELGAVGGAALSTNAGHQVPVVPKPSTTAFVGGVKRYSQKHRTADPGGVVGDGKRANKEDQITHHGISLSSTCLAIQTNGSGDLIDQDLSNDNRSVRAHSVPVDNSNLEGERAGRFSGAQTKRLKTNRRKQKSIFFSDTSSDSSSSSGQERRARPGAVSKAGKNKRWLMTRFLRSVIFSDSSSTDNSDTDKTSGQTEQHTSRSTGNPLGVIKSSSHHPSATSSSSHQPSATSSSSHQPSATSSSSHRPSASRPSSRQPSADSVFQSGSQIKGPCGINIGSDILLESKPGRAARNSDQLQEQREHQLSSSVGITQSQRNYSRELDSPRLQETGDHQALESSVQSPLDSNTALKEPAAHTSEASPQPKNSRLKTGKSTISADHFEVPALDRSLGSDTADVLPTLYDNLNSSAGLSDNSVQSVYDNTIGDHRGACTPVLLRDPNFNPCQQESVETNLPHFSRTEARTLYDNIDDSELILEDGVPVSPTYPGRHIQIRNPPTEIEELKTGYEHLIPASDDSATPYNVVVVSAGEDEAVGSKDSETPSSVGSEIHRDPNIIRVGRGFSELGENARELCENVEHSPNLDTVRSAPENSGDRMSHLNTQSSAMGATLATREGSSTGSNLQLIAPGEQQQNTCGRVDIADDEFEFVENYFDTSSEEACGKNLSHINLAPSCFAIGGGETSEAPPTPATASLTQSTEPADGARRNNNNNVKADDSSEEEEEEEDDNSHPGTSMLQNKKKPRSRLKKFLTSLLSLSSSDDDDENFDVRTSSSSKSSDW